MADVKLSRDREKTVLIEIVDRCRSRDEQAWHELVDMIAPMIFAICQRMNLSREESFDIFGQVCGVLVSGINRLESPNKLLSYVSTITRRHISELMRRARVFDTLDEEVLTTVADQSSAPPDRLIEIAQQSERLNKALSRLQPREYELIRALFLEDSVSYEQLSDRLGMPVSSIGPTRARTLKKLQKLLQQQTCPGGNRSKLKQWREDE